MKSGFLLKTAVTFGSIILCVLPMDLHAQLSTGEKDTLFIANVKVLPSVSESTKKGRGQSSLDRFAESFNSELLRAINASRVFQLVERERLTEVLNEQAFANSGLVAQDKTAAEIGKLSGAKFALMPQIDAFEDNHKSTNYTQIGRASVSRSLFLSASVRIVDTTSGRILPDSPSIQINRGKAADMVAQGTTLNDDALLVTLASEAASKLAQEVIVLLRPAKVLTVTGTQVMINRGTEAGFKPGSKVEFYATQDVLDEDTGEVFRNEVPVGHGIIERADSRQSFAKVNGEDLGVAKGCVVKISVPVVRKDGGKRQPPAVENKGSEMTAGSSEAPWNF